MFSALEESLLALVHTIPLPLFVPFASFVEELIAPIPSPTVMMIAGSALLVQGGGLHTFFLLVFLASVGKTLGALTVYTLVRFGEGIFMKRFGTLFNVTEDDVLRFQSRVGTGVRAYVMFTVLRSLPIIPSVVLSVGSGLVKIPIKVFVLGTFLGTLVRDSFYLYAGYAGTKVLENLISHSSSIEDVFEILAVLLLLGFICYRLYVKYQVREVS